MTIFLLLTNISSFYITSHASVRNVSGPQPQISALMLSLGLTFIYVNLFFQVAQEKVSYRQIWWTQRPKIFNIFQNYSYTENSSQVLYVYPGSVRSISLLLEPYFLIMFDRWTESICKHCPIKGPVVSFCLTFLVFKEIRANNCFSHNTAPNSVFLGGCNQCGYNRLGYSVPANLQFCSLMHSFKWKWA